VSEGARDPWTEVLDRHFASPSRAGEPSAGAPVGRSVRVTPRRLAVAAGALAILLAAVGVLAYLAAENRSRADAWRDRARALEGVVADRTRALNRQTARLNVASATLREARAALARSEADVQELERRQRELADEKAQLEDERAALRDVAGKLAACRSGLLLLLRDVVLGVEPDPPLVSEVEAACDAADAAMAAYGPTVGPP
jgi:hypothetical protein